MNSTHACSAGLEKPVWDSVALALQGADHRCGDRLGRGRRCRSSIRRPPRSWQGGAQEAPRRAAEGGERVLPPARGSRRGARHRLRPIARRSRAWTMASSTSVSNPKASTFFARRFDARETSEILVVPARRRRHRVRDRPRAAEHRASASSAATAPTRSSTRRRSPASVTSRTALRRRNGRWRVVRSRHDVRPSSLGEAERSAGATRRRLTARAYAPARGDRAIHRDVGSTPRSASRRYTYGFDAAL